MNEKKQKTAAQIIADVSPNHKDAFDAAVHMTIQSAKRAFPDMDDATLGKFCECIARIVSGFQILPVGHLNHALDSMFSAYFVASASLEGLIDVGDTPEHVQEIIRQATEENSGDKDDESYLRDTGQYL